MSSARHEHDRLWQWIDEQKRPSRVPGRRPSSDLYSHDVQQNWVQAVSASLRSGRRRPASRKRARKRLEKAIALSLRSRSLGAALPSKPIPGRRCAWIAAACVLALSVAAALLLLVPLYRQ